MNTNPFESNIFICNSRGSLSYVAIEPWGEEVSLRKGDQLHVVARGPAKEGIVQLTYEGDALFLHAWRGSTLSFTLNGKALNTASAVIPSL